MPGTTTSSRFRHRYLDAGGIRLHMAEVPGARPMVMLHGIGMDWRVWQAISRRLVPDFHLYLVDLRGHGQSDKPEAGYTIGHYAADVEELVDRLGLRDALLVGSSLGGVVAAATELPTDMASHKILVDPPLTGGPLRDPENLQTIFDLKHGQKGPLADYLQQSNPGLGRFLAEMMAELWQTSADGVIEAPLSNPDHYFEMGSALEATEQPVLLLQADPERGQSLSDVDAERALQLLPDARLVRVPGSGHAIHATNPEQFGRLVRDFVESA